MFEYKDFSNNAEVFTSWQPSKTSIYVVKFNGKLVICQPSDDGLTYLLPVKWWNIRHICALLVFAFRGEGVPMNIVDDYGDRMSEYTPQMVQMLDRMDPTFGRLIDCGQGWWPLISELHNKISALDEDYRIYQIKEKFGVLRFYYASSKPHLQDQINALVSEYELLSSQTCEITGGLGEIMFRNGVYKTLSKSFIDEGWKPVSSKE